MTRYLKRYLAQRRLDRIVKKTRESFEVQDYARRRAAAKKGIARKQIERGCA